MDEFNDDDIARAIALSLQDAPAPAATTRPTTRQPDPSEIIEIEDSDEDEPIRAPPIMDEEALFQAELQRAIEASKGSEPPRQPSPPKATPSTSNSFLSARAQMEQERLARLKRLRPDVTPNVSNRDGDSDEEDEDEDEEGDGQPSSKRQRFSQSTSSSRRANNGSSSARISRDTGKQKATAEDAFFWNGELRQTANAYVEPAKDTRPTFRLSEIIGPKDDLDFVIASAYCINWPWIYEFFNRSTPVIMIAQDAKGNETIKEVLPNWIKTTPFLRGGRGCMHMKFMLLFYKTGRLRVAVSTANFVEYDWKQIENTVWVQDVPLRSDPIPHDPKATDFPATMVRILRSLNVVPALLSQTKNGHNPPINRIEDLRSKWDFTKVKVYLIPSIAGKHEGWQNVVFTGHTGLMKALRDMGARAKKSQSVTLECQGSSIGLYSTQWMNEFHCSARGDGADEWLDQSKARRSKLPFPSIKILFPSTRTVRESVAGEAGGGTMFCRRQQWQGNNFPRDLFYDSNSRRGGVLMHSKMIIATFRDSAFTSKGKNSQSSVESDSETASEGDADIVEVDPHAGSKIIGWAYVGSHNFTPSAWGTLSGSAFNPILNITNYELGIAFPLRSEEELEKVACWKRPPRKYVLGKDEPWMQEESPYLTGS